MTTWLSLAKTQLHVNATPWLESLQGYCHEHPEEEQMVYDYLQQWGDRIDDLLATSASLSGQLALLAGQWSAYQGGHIELRLLGADMEERETHLHAPYSDQIAGMLNTRCANLRHSGLDVRVSWWPDPGYAMARMEGVIPAEGDSYVFSPGSLFSDEDIQRFTAVLRDPQTTIA